ncbi:MAG: PA14 domain-containing protein, partial [Candidatus Saccharibacteria bacterium]
MESFEIDMGTVKQKLRSFTRVRAERVLTLLIAVLMFGTILMPPISAYATEAAASTASTPTVSSDPVKPNTHIAKTNPADATPMKTNYPGPIAATQSSAPGATDAQPLNTVLSLLTKQKTAPAEGVQPKPESPKITAHELVNERTASTSVVQNADGTLTKKQFFGSQFYKNNGTWTTIDPTLVADTNAGDATNAVTRLFGQVESDLSSTTNFTVKANDWQARFGPSDFDGGMVRVKKGTSQIGFTPINAKQVAPVIGKTGDGKQVVHYYDLWPGVNVDYVVTNDEVKENIIIKDKNATNQVSFKLNGADLQQQKVAQGQVAGYDVKGALGDGFGITPVNLILNNFGFVSDTSVFSQNYSNGTLTTAIKEDYLQSLPAKAFPAVIDPNLTSYAGDRTGGTYMAFKSDGYVCYSNQCNMYAGTLYDSNGYERDWEGAMYVPYGQISGGALQSATLHLTQRSNESFWTGTWDAHTYGVGHATCLTRYDCYDGIWSQGVVAGGSGNIDVTNLYRDRITNNDFGAWIQVVSLDNSDSSFKNFDPSGTYVSFNYTGKPAAPSFTTPVSGQVYVDPQASFSISPMTAPDGVTQLQYETLVSNAPGASGTVIDSGLMASRQWTVPDGLLQDGSTYYVQARSYDPSTLTYSDWGTSIPFKIDMRTGKDNTQTFDSLGPVNADLATGNVSTSESSHSTAALGGTIGVSLNYNSALRSRSGLVGEYWNIPANTPFSTTVPSNAAVVTRPDQNVDFDWASGSPASNVSSSWFYTRWSGFFVAPTSGTFYFGGMFDDALAIYANNNNINLVPGSGGNCYTTICYGSGVTLQAGQVIPLSVLYEQATGADYMHLYVKGPVAEQVVPNAWLQSGVRDIANQHGLTGRYYNDDGTHNLDSTTKSMYMQRVDQNVSFDWGLGSAVPGGPTDNFMTRWSGYFTAPVNGNYQFGTKADDGSRVTVNGTQLLNNWQDTPNLENWGGSISLTAGQTVPIVVDYYEHGGGAAIALEVQGAVAAQVVPTSWLSPKAQVL